jgi:hypothetical protein
LLINDSAPSVLPWKAPSAQMNPGRPDATRAILSAPSIASVPELQMKAFEIGPGAIVASRRHAIPLIGSSSSWVGIGLRSSCARTAATTSGWRIPSE